MLVLMRHVNESIIIGDDIKIVITKHVGGKIWIGIEAPKEVSVNREEVWLKIKREAAKGNPE